MMLPLAEKHVTLRKQGAHYVGTCPKCGGSSDTTRFVVNVAKDFCQCYSCGFNADPVRFLREIEGHTCPEAHRILGLDCDSPDCPVWEKCSRGRGTRPKEQKSAMATPALAPERTAPAFAAGEATTPAELWQQKADKLVERAHLALLDNPEQLAYLAARGLPREAVERYKLGYVPADFYRDRPSWGLPVELKSDNKPKKLYIPQGILIPWFSSPPVPGPCLQVHRIRIRKQTLRNDKDARYYWLPGSGNDIICINPAAPAHVVVESDLDGLLIDWQAGDLVGTIPLGSCSTHPKASALAALEKSLCILGSLDFDTPKWDEEKQQWIAPGAKASGWWSKTFPRTYKRWPVPTGKDPGEAFKAAVDLRAWVLAGLPPALRVAKTVDQGPVIKNQVMEKTPSPAPDTKRSVSASQPPSFQLSTQEQPAYQTITAADGRRFIITDDAPTYAQMVAAGRIVFDSHEMRHVVTCADTPEQAAAFLNFKQVFPGIRITESVDLRGSL